MKNVSKASVLDPPTVEFIQLMPISSVYKNSEILYSDVQYDTIKWLRNLKRLRGFIILGQTIPLLSFPLRRFFKILLRIADTSPACQ